VRKEGRYSEAEGDNCQSVEVNEEEYGVGVGVVHDGAVARRYKENSRNEDTTESQRRRELERPRTPVQITLHPHQLH